MTDKIEELIERLRDAAALPNGLYAEAATVLRTQRDEVDAIAERLEDQRDEPFPGSELERLHYWREKALNAATAIRNLKSQDEPR